MGRRLLPPTNRPVIAGLLLAFISIIGISNTALANTEVNLHVPVGYIEVQGKTSPNAQVKIYENGNEIPAASVTSDASGAFSEQLPQDATGLVNISIRSIDTDGKQSALITKQVAIIAQQTSTLTVTMPPTIAVNPTSAVFKTGTLTFSGQSIPNATVEVTIEPSTILTATSDNNGRFTIPLLVESLKSVGVYSYGVKVTSGAEQSDYITAGTFVISPPSTKPVTPPNRPFQRIFRSLAGTPTPVPNITFIDGTEYSTTEPIVLTGTAEPGSVVTIYDGDKAIGTIIAGADGKWSFYFSPYKDIHVLSAQACINGRCSEKSAPITIKRPNSEKVPACRAGITLNSYRLSAKTGTPAEIAGMLPKGSKGIVYIAWGDATNERFDKPEDDRLKVSHTYQKAGTYSGYVILNDSDTCQSATYFAIEVTDPISPISVAAITTATIFGLAVLGLIARRFLPLLRR